MPLPSEDLRVLLFQIVRELLFNVVKHAATNEATVSLSHRDGRMWIAVRDEGRGFIADDEGAKNSQGLTRIRQRLELIGGQMQIISSPGQGTEILLSSPLNGDHAFARDPY
jgi:signal transduction histidine kinase